MPNKSVLESLINELEAAFPSQGLDGGISLQQAEVMDDFEGDDTAKMRKAYDADVTNDWKAVSAKDLDSVFDNVSVFRHLDAKGWRYYLPAALRHSLRNPGSACEFDTRLSLLPGKPGPGEPAWDLDFFEKQVGLSKQQGCVVARVLSLLKEGDKKWYAKHPDESAQLEAWRARFCEN